MLKNKISRFSTSGVNIFWSLSSPDNTEYLWAVDKTRCLRTSPCALGITYQYFSPFSHIMDQRTN